METNNAHFSDSYRGYEKCIASMSYSSKKARQRGQVLPFATAFVVLALSLFYFATNTAQMSVEKTRVTNAADAGAYSAAIVQARALNLTAYTNRAIIANQVGVAQMLTLNNELNHIVSFYSATDASVIETLGEGVGWATIPTDEGGRDRYIKHAGITAGSLVAQFYGYSPQQFIEYILPYGNYIASAVITAADTASVIMENQMAALWNPVDEFTVGARSLRAAQEVATAMDGDIRVEASISALNSAAPSIVKRYSNDERDRVQGVVLDALAPYIRNRDENAYSGVLRAGRVRVGLERRGETRMRDYDVWEVEDKQDYRYWSPSLFRPFRTRTDPIEGAWTQIGPNSNNEARYLAYVNRNTVIDEFVARYSGLPSVFDVDDDHSSASTATPFRPGVTVIARKAKDRTKTSGHVDNMTPSGRLNVFDSTPEAGNEISAMARAEIIFTRPPRADGRAEQPNLYNPYWTVRLTSPVAEDYLTYVGRRFWN
jgi:hypothetical protein